MAQNLPDGEILFRSFLVDKTSITDIVSTRVATRLPQNATLPFLVITQFGGQPSADEALIYEATFMVDSYAGKYGSGGSKGQPDYAGSYNLAKNIVSETFDAKPAKYTSDGGETGIIYGFYSQTGPSRVDEPELGLARYNIEVVMVYGAVT